MNEDFLLNEMNKIQYLERDGPKIQSESFFIGVIKDKTETGRAIAMLMCFLKKLRDCLYGKRKSEYVKQYLHLFKKDWFKLAKDSKNVISRKFSQ